MITWGAVLTSAVVFAAGLVVGKGILKIVRLKETLQRLAITGGVGIVGCAVANLHLRVFDPWFLKLGRIDRVFAKSKTDATTAERADR